MTVRKKKRSNTRCPVNPDNYKTVPALAAYVDRVADGKEVDQRNFRRLVLIGENESGYKKDRVVITVAKDGTVSAPEKLQPTDQELKKIKAAFAKIKFPDSIPATRSGSDDQRIKIGVQPVDWFELRDVTRNSVLMCQQRIRLEGDKKIYRPWTLWSDGNWREMEPDSDSLAALPMWKPMERRKTARVMVHEGAKTARQVDCLVNDDTTEAREARAAHPWALELSNYEHWGWIGGANNPHRTDWQELAHAKWLEIAIAADNDLLGQQAIKHIARALVTANAPVTAVMFDDSFERKFDLADEFPRKFWIKDRYRGPTLKDCCRSATWATKTIAADDKRGRPLIIARPEFIKQWVSSITPAVFVHREHPSRLLDAVQFNAAVLPFSDAQNTAAILGREPASLVDGVAYEPGRDQGIVTMDGLRLFNTWTPTRVSRSGGDVSRWLKFLEELIPAREDREQLSRWIATLIARPEVRMRYGVLLISETQGVGKGTLMERILAPLVGWQNVSVPSEKQLTESGFNSWLVRKRLVLVHEIYAGHSKKAYDSIKSNVTDDTLDVNEKNLKPYSIHNWTHFVLSSNSPLALRMVKGDRRWFVPKVTEEKPTGGPRHWIELNAWLVSGGLEAIHNWAHDYVEQHGAVSSGDEAPNSEAKEQMIETSRSEGQQMVFDLGEAAAKSKTPIVLKDREVRNWMASNRNLDVNHPHVESQLTVGKELRQAGMLEAVKGKDHGGVRWLAFANEAAMKLAGWSPRPTWKELGGFHMPPHKVEKVDEDGPS